MPLRNHIAAAIREYIEGVWKIFKQKISASILAANARGRRPMTIAVIIAATLRRGEWTTTANADMTNAPVRTIGDVIETETCGLPRTLERRLSLWQIDTTTKEDGADADAVTHRGTGARREVSTATRKNTINQANDILAEKDTSEAAARDMAKVIARATATTVRIRRRLEAAAVASAVRPVRAEAGGDGAAVHSVVSPDHRPDPMAVAVIAAAAVTAEARMAVRGRNRNTAAVAIIAEAIRSRSVDT
jgi:hypothetical protein